MRIVQKIREFLANTPDEQYVDPLAGECTIDEIHAQALLEDKQRTLHKRMRTEGKSILCKRRTIYSPSYNSPVEAKGG